MKKTIQDIRAAISQRRFDEAARLRDSLPEAARATEQVRLLTAQILLGQGKDDETLALLRELGDGGDRRKTVLLLRSRVEERQKRFADLRDTLTGLIPLDPGNARLYLRLAKAQLLTDAPDAALASNQAAEAHGAPEAEVLRQRAAILTRTDATEALARTYERLAVLEPGEMAHLRHLAPLLVTLDRKDEAREVSRRLVETWPAAAPAYETAFAVAAGTGAAEEAARVIEAAVAAAATAPRFAKFVIMHLGLPQDRIAGLVDRLCARWPDTFEAEFGRASHPKEPEFEIVLAALQDKAGALKAAEALVAGWTKQPMPQRIGLMTRVIAALPDPGALRRPLVIDDGSEMLVSPPGDTGLTVVAFGGGGLRLGYNFEVIDSLCASHGASAIYCRDVSLRLFLSGLSSLGPSREETTAVLRAKLAELGTKRLVVLTSSGGCMGGIPLTLPLDPARYVLISPQTEISVAAVAPLGLSPAMLEVARRFEESYPPVDLDLAGQFASGASARDIRISFGAANPYDRSQAERLAALPGVTLLPVEGWTEHGTMPPLIASRELERLLFG